VDAPDAGGAVNKGDLPFEDELDRIDEADGGGARLSGCSDRSEDFVEGTGGAKPRRREAGTGSILGIWWSWKEKWEVVCTVSFGFSTRSSSSRKRKSRPYS
jgi:hypothetical protein